MRSILLAAAGVGLLGLVIFIPQREHGNVSEQERLFFVRVPKDFPTIQQAVDAVAEGGTVLIGPGTYQENIRITKSIRLVGAGQDLVQIHTYSPQSPTIAISAERPIQVYMTDFTMREMDFLDSTGIDIKGAVQAIVERVTIKGDYNTPYQYGIVIGGDSWGILLKVTISYTRTAIRAGNNLIIKDSIIKDNNTGILITGGSDFQVWHTLLSDNKLIAIILIGSFLSGVNVSLIENKIISNGGGVYLGHDYYHENLMVLKRPITRVIMMLKNQIVGNAVYGLALLSQECLDKRLPVEISIQRASLDGTAFMGMDNEIKGNNKADLCPADYPWPPGFRK